jgi:uncharacterized protein YbbC (DUF1343 family)
MNNEGTRLVNLYDDYYSKNRKLNLIIIVVIIAFTVLALVTSLALIFSLIAKNSPFDPPAVKPGIDGDISLLYGKRVGLITNPSGVNHALDSTIDVLAKQKRVKLVSLFAPEHGIRGDKLPGERFDDYTDPLTNLPVYSLYNRNHTNAPTTTQLKDIDMLVLDLQDVGARCFTYISTMAACLKAAQNASVPFVILDRSNPIGARDSDIQGPVLKPDYKSFIGVWTIPMQHAMSMGELARMFNTEMGINHDALYVIKITQANPTQRSPDGVPVTRKPLAFENARWVPPSPNLPTLTSSWLYPGMVLFEATQLISLGRGTTTPFQVIGAPFINPEQLIADINELKSDAIVSGYFEHVHVIPVYFIPQTSPYLNKQCAGIRLILTHPTLYDPTKSLPIAITILSALLKQFPIEQLGLDRVYMQELMGTDDLYAQLMNKMSVPEIEKSWEPLLLDFKNRRVKYLLYYRFLTIV